MLLLSKIDTDTPHSYFMIYETKGLSLEQVDELYGVVGKAWKSKDFRPQVQYNDVDPSRDQKLSMMDIAENQSRKRSVQHEEMMPAGKI
jgi:SP family sugar:H+ symporter-like MFS transporter